LRWVAAKCSPWKTTVPSVLNIRQKNRLLGRGPNSVNCPPAANLLLQLLPAFTEAEAGCPVLTIKPMIVDLEHAPTLDRI
jgi:hypothetical protein